MSCFHHELVTPARVSGLAALYVAAPRGYINNEKRQSKAKMSRAIDMGEPKHAARKRMAVARFCGMTDGRLLPDIASLLLTSP